MATKSKPRSHIAISAMGGSANLKKNGRKQFVKMALKRWHPEKFAQKYPNG